MSSIFDPSHSADLTECPGGDCGAEMGPYGMTYAHKHCGIDGCVLMAYPGGGDDGRGIDGYEDSEKCCDCGDLVHEKCARQNFPSGAPLCHYCLNKEIGAAFQDALPVLNLQNALKDVQDSKLRLGTETEPENLDAMRRLIGQLRSAVADCDNAITQRRMRLFDTTMPLPLNAA